MNASLNGIGDDINVMTPEQIYQQFIVSFGLSSSKEDNAPVNDTLAISSILCIFVEYNFK